MAHNPLHEYVLRHGEEETARRLTQALGREISLHAVRLNKGANPKRRPPIVWLHALGLDTRYGGSSDNPPPKPVPGLSRQPLSTDPLPPLPSEEDPPAERMGGADTSDGDVGAQRAAEEAPKPPEDADFQLPDRRAGALIYGGARERIASLHVFAGSAIATASDADGFEHDRGIGGGVAKLWTDKSDQLAEAWIAWAEEGNRFAQSFCRLMQSGGAGGSLALGYAALLGGTAYILGHMPDNEATRVLYGRYASYRTVVPAPDRDQEQRRAGDNGAAPAGSEDQLDDATAPAGF